MRQGLKIASDYCGRLASKVKRTCPQLAGPTSRTIWRTELLYPKLLFSCADFPGNTGQIARAEQGGRSCFAKRMECVELAPAVRCVARFESGSKLHALHTLRAVWFRLRRAGDRRALPSRFMGKVYWRHASAE